MIVFALILAYIAPPIIATVRGVRGWGWVWLSIPFGWGGFWILAMGYACFAPNARKRAELASRQIAGIDMLYDPGAVYAVGPSPAPPRQSGPARLIIEQSPQLSRAEPVLPGAMRATSADRWKTSE